MGDISEYQVVIRDFFFFYVVVLDFEQQVVSDRPTLPIDNVGEDSPRHSVNRHRGHFCKTLF